jgi:hypothetical protein
MSYHTTRGETKTRTTGKPTSSHCVHEYLCNNNQLFLESSPTHELLGLVQELLGDYYVACPPSLSLHALLLRCTGKVGRTEQNNATRSVYCSMACMRKLNLDYSLGAPSLFFACSSPPVDRFRWQDKSCVKEEKRRSSLLRSVLALSSRFETNRLKVDLICQEAPTLLHETRTIEP